MNLYVDDSSLLLSVAKKESSKLSSPSGCAEEETTLVKQSKCQQLTFMTKGLELVKGHTHTPISSLTRKDKYMKFKKNHILVV
jgi:hypothetical protein